MPVLCHILRTGSLPLGWGGAGRHSTPLTWAHQPFLLGQTLGHTYWWLAVYHLGPRLKFLSLYSLLPIIKMLWDFISWQDCPQTTLWVLEDFIASSLHTLHTHTHTHTHTLPCLLVITCHNSILSPLPSPISRTSRWTAKSMDSCMLCFFIFLNVNFLN